MAKPDGGIEIMQDVHLSKQRARTLRKNMTEAERKLWRRLRGQQLGIRFRRQVVMGRYIVDFLCLDPKIIIEGDGSQHADDVHYDAQWKTCFNLPHPASPPSPAGKAY